MLLLLFLTFLASLVPIGRGTAKGHHFATILQNIGKGEGRYRLRLHEGLVRIHGRGVQFCRQVAFALHPLRKRVIIHRILCVSEWPNGHFVILCIAEWRKGHFAIQCVAEWSHGHFSILFAGFRLLGLQFATLRFLFTRWWIVVLWELVGWVVFGE